MTFKNDYFSFDDTQLPFVTFHLNGKEFTDAALKEFLAMQESVISLETPIVILYKAENLKYLKSDHRIKLGQWSKDNEALIKRNVLAVGYQVHSMFGKMLLNGIFLVQKPVYPYLISQSEEDIQNFFEKHLEEAQVAVQ